MSQYKEYIQPIGECGIAFTAGGQLYVVTMPPELRKAHQENDKAVMEAYGFNPRMSEAEIVAELFKLYQEITQSR